MSQYYLDVLRFDGQDYYCPDCQSKMNNIHPFSQSTLNDRQYHNWSCEGCQFGVYHVENKKNPIEDSTFIWIRFSFNPQNDYYVQIGEDQYIWVELRTVYEEDLDDEMSFQNGLIPPRLQLSLPYVQLNYSDLPALHRKFQLYMILS